MRRVAAFVFACALAGAAAAFPNRPMRILVPFPPGGGTDVAARALADSLQRETGQPVVVDNRPGGNSVIATEAVARAEPDGHVALLTTDFHAINAAFALPLAYDALRDFAFVTRVSTSPLMLVASPTEGLATLAAAVAHARAHPGRASFASLGGSSPHHLGFEWFKRMAGIDVLDVPYKGGGPALAAVMGGQATLSFVVATNGARQAAAGKLAALAVTGPVRAAAAPSVPTFAESGYPEFVLLNWYGVLLPAATPRATVERLNALLVKALRDPPVVARLAGAGVDAAPGTPQEFEQWVRADIARYRRIIELTGAKPDGR